MSLEFKVELTGNFRGALEQDAQAAEKAEGATKKHRHELELFESEVGKAKAELGGFAIDLQAFSKGGAIFTFDLAEGLRSAVELAGELVEKVFDLGKEIVQIAGKTQDIDLAVKLNVGDEKAVEINELAERFEKTTRFDASDIKQALLPLLQQGLGKNVDQLTDIATAATDYAARTNSGIEGVKTALESFGNIALRGQVNFKLLRTLKISEEQFNGGLAELLHTDSKSAEQLMKQGKAGKDNLLNTALSLLAAQQGGALGEPTLRSAATLGATLDRLSNLKENLFEKLANSPVMDKVQASLDRFVSVMRGEAGDKLVAQIGDVFDRLANWLTPERIEGWVDSLSHIGDTFDKWKGKLDTVISVAETLGVIWTGGKIIGGITAVAEALPALGTAAGGVLAVVTSISAPVVAVAAAFGAVAVAIYEAIKAYQDWHRLKVYTDDAPPAVANDTVNENSPAWKKARYAAQGGTDIPMMADGGIVDRATLAVVGEAGPEAIVPLSKADGFGGQTVITYAPQYHVSGAQAGQLRAELEDADRDARQAFARVVQELLAS